MRFESSLQLQKQALTGQPTKTKASIAIGTTTVTDSDIKDSEEVVIHLRGHYLGQAFHCPCADRLWGKQEWQVPYHPTQGDRPVALC